MNTVSPNFLMNTQGPWFVLLLQILLFFIWLATRKAWRYIAEVISLAMIKLNKDIWKYCVSLWCRHKKGADREDTCCEKFSLLLRHLPSQLQQALLPCLRRGDHQEQDPSGIPCCWSLEALSAELPANPTQSFLPVLSMWASWDHRARSESLFRALPGQHEKYRLL